MISYSCDRCKRVLDPEADVRYVVSLESYVELHPLDSNEPEDDRDHLLEIEELLERCDSFDDDSAAAKYHKMRFDLCADCHAEFLKNPVGREASAVIGFSNN